MSLDILVSDLSRFLHHVTKVSGHRKVALALAYRAFDEKDLTSHSCPGKACNHSRSLIALLHIVRIGRKTEIFAKMLFLYDSRIFLFESNFLGCYTSHFGNLLFKTSDTGLVSIFIDDLRDGSLVELELSFLQAVLLYLLRNQIVLCYLILLFRQITAHIDHLHTVLESRLDGIDAVRCRNEKYIRQIIVNIKIIIVESRILLRIKSFKERRRRISLYILCKLVHFIKYDHRIGSTGTVDAVKNTSRKCSDVSLSVSSDLGLVVHTSQCDAYIFAPESPSYGLAKAGLSHSRRAVQTEDRRLHITLELEDSKVFDDPFLHLLKTVMVLIKHLLGILQVKIIV